MRWLNRVFIAAAVLWALLVATLIIAWHVSPFPTDSLERWPVSAVVTDRYGRPMLELVGADDQWRKPAPLHDVSPWVIKATIAVEDERFYDHGGVDVIAACRALLQNVSAGRVVSGASTLTMQVCRMMADRPRTLRAKLVESFRALQLEQLRSKDEIIELYLNAAPYGGNVRGVAAAAHLYFGKRAADLSLGEAALLAGLPQSPSRLRPDRYPDAARARRDTVLERMVELGMITPHQQADAAAEPVTLRSLRSQPAPATDARHAAWLALQRRPAGGRTTIDPDVQAAVQQCVREHMTALPPRTDAAVVVIDITNGDIVALIGSADPTDPVDGQVNGVIARRSPGSTLKPFVYAAAFESRRLGPQSIVYDVPIERGGWAPMNFDKSFSGQVTVEQALKRSLNVPAILTAEGVGLSRCMGLVEAAGVKLPTDASSRGGLAVVVGAVEVTLLDLTNAYATLGRGGVRQSARLFVDEPVTSTRVLNADVCAALGDMLSSRRRRPRGMADRATLDVPWFMWKTGTSSGRRDAWAVGHNGRFAIGVWVGRFSGAGHHAFVGGQAAEPLLARLFALAALRVDGDPPTPGSTWVVTNPLPPPAEVRSALRIVEPHHATTLIALDGHAFVRLRANRSDGVQWFVDGRLVAHAHQRIALAPGAHEVRCIESSGGWAASSVVVR